MIDRKSGTYHVTFAAACPDASRCEREMMEGFIFTCIEPGIPPDDWFPAESGW
jgi:hypothetical protein